MWKMLNVGFFVFYCKSVRQIFDSECFGDCFKFVCTWMLCLAPLTGILYWIILFLLHSSEILFVFCKLSLTSQEEVSEKTCNF